MGSKNLRSSGSSASGLKGGLKAWLQGKKGAEISADECTDRKVHLFSKKKTYSVSRSSDFNWEITRYDRQPGYESVRAEFEKRRTVDVEVPKVETHVRTAEKVQEPMKTSARPAVPTLDVYFKEESIKAETKVAARPEVKTEVKAYRQESLFDREPKMVEAEEDNKYLTGVSYFSSISSAVEMPTCSTVSEMPVQTQIFDSFEEEKAEDSIEVISEIASNEECSTVIEISKEDLFIESLCEDLATFTVMNDILPEIMAEEEFVQEEAEYDDVSIEDICEDLVAKFIIDELMPELLKKKGAPAYVPEYVISEITDAQVSETVIDIPETVVEVKAEEKKSEVTAFLFGFGTSAQQKKGTTGFTFVFGNDDDADYDDEEIASVSVNDAAITASSLSGNPVGL